MKKNKMPRITIGDFCDRFTINRIKNLKYKDNPVVKLSEVECMKELEFKTREKSASKLFLKLMEELYQSNLENWRLMDKVITENNLEDAGKAAKKLVKVNCDRVFLKNQLSQIFDENYIERKNYGDIYII